jgi:hypothetical protein
MPELLVWQDALSQAKNAILEPNDGGTVKNERTFNPGRVIRRGGDVASVAPM